MIGNIPYMLNKSNSIGSEQVCICETIAIIKSTDLCIISTSFQLPFFLLIIVFIIINFMVKHNISSAVLSNVDFLKPAI